MAAFAYPVTRFLLGAGGKPAHKLRRADLSSIAVWARASKAFAPTRDFAHRFWRFCSCLSAGGPRALLPLRARWRRGRFGCGVPRRAGVWLHGAPSCAYVEVLRGTDRTSFKDVGMRCTLAPKAATSRAQSSAHLTGVPAAHPWPSRRLSISASPPPTPPPTAALARPTRLWHQPPDLETLMRLALGEAPMLALREGNRWPLHPAMPGPLPPLIWPVPAGGGTPPRLGQVSQEALWPEPPHARAPDAARGAHTGYPDPPRLSGGPTGKRLAPRRLCDDTDWQKSIDARIARVKDAGTETRRSPHSFRTWQRPSNALCDAMPPCLRGALDAEGDFVGTGEGARRLFALCALARMPPRTFRIATFNADGGYDFVQLSPHESGGIGGLRTDNAPWPSQRAFLAASIPPIAKVYMIVIEDGVYLTLHGEALPHMGPALRLLVGEPTASLGTFVGAARAQGRFDVVNALCCELLVTCLNGQMQAIEQALLHLSQDAQAAEAVLPPSFAPHESDADRAAKLALYERRVSRQAWASAQSADADTTDGLDSVRMRAVLAQTPAIRDRSAAGLDYLVRYLADDLMLFD